MDDGWSSTWNSVLDAPFNEDSSTIVWTQAGVTLSAHPNRPTITAQLTQNYLNTKQSVELAQSPIITASPAFYTSPRCLALSPEGDHLFAYFPPSALSVEGGLSCVWERGSDIMSWTFKEAWKTERGNCVMASHWLGQTQQGCTWTSSTFSPSKPGLSRLPPLGPRTLRTPTLMTVMQQTEVQIHIHTPFKSTSGPYFNHMRASLRSPSRVFESSIQDLPQLQDENLGMKICLKAAIGLGYNESSILIIMHSKILPPPRDFTPADFSLSFEPNAPPTPLNYGPTTDECGALFESESIEVCEVQVDIFNPQRNLITRPLFSIPSQVVLNSQNENFGTLASNNSNEPSTPPPSLGKRVRQIKAIPAVASTLDQIVQVKESLYSGIELVVLYSHECEPPHSELCIWSLQRTKPVNSSLSWSAKPVATRTFLNTVLIPSISGTPDGNGILVGKIATHDSLASVVDDPITKPSKGTTTKPGKNTGKRKKVQKLGFIMRLRITDLSDDENCPPIPILSRARTRDISSSIITSFHPSPNHALLALRSGIFSQHNFTIISAPLPSKAAASQNISPASRPSASIAPTNIIPSLSLLLASSFLNSTDSRDITRLFWAKCKVEDTAPLIQGALDLLPDLYSVREKVGEGSQSERPRKWTMAAFGFLVDLYKHCPSEEISRRWHTSFAICELMACERAFEETTDPRGALDLSASWQHVLFGQHVMHVFEDIVRDAFLWEGERKWERLRGEGMKAEGAAPSDKPEPESEVPITYSSSFLPLLLNLVTLNSLRRLVTYLHVLQAMFNRLRAEQGLAVAIVKLLLQSLLETGPLTPILPPTVSGSGAGTKPILMNPDGKHATLERLVTMLEQVESELRRVLGDDAAAHTALSNFNITFAPSPQISTILDTVARVVTRSFKLDDKKLDSATPGADSTAHAVTNQAMRLIIPLDDLLDTPLALRRAEEKDVITKASLDLRTSQSTKNPSLTIATSAATGVPPMLVVPPGQQPPIRTCVRCESKSEMKWQLMQVSSGASTIPDGVPRVGVRMMKIIPKTSGPGWRWLAWEGEWEKKCICGGAWINETSLRA